MGHKFSAGEQIRGISGLKYTVVATFEKTGNRDMVLTSANNDVFLALSTNYDLVPQIFEKGKYYQSEYGSIVEVIDVHRSGAIGWTCNRTEPHVSVSPWSISRTELGNYKEYKW